MMTGIAGLARGFALTARAWVRRGGARPAGRDDLLAELTALAAAVNQAVARAEIHAADRTARIDLWRFGTLERAARRASAVVLGHGADDGGKGDGR